MATVSAQHEAITFLALAALAAAALVVGSYAALAPDREVACLAPTESIGAGDARIEEPLDPAQRALVEHVSRRFLVATQATEHMVVTAYRAAQRVGLDPLLVLAVISVESRFNPIAESGMGAKGLMQIIPKYHRAKLLEHGGDEAVLDPQSNILVGARILQEYVYRTGTLEAGLQSYNGAAWDESAMRPPCRRSRRSPWIRCDRRTFASKPRRRRGKSPTRGSRRMLTSWPTIGGYVLWSIACARFTS
jgi:soluble lytic murein transglycosylase-like protein